MTAGRPTGRKHLHETRDCLFVLAAPRGPRERRPLQRFDTRRQVSIGRPKIGWVPGGKTATAKQARC